MHKEFIERPEIKLVGISIRTNNQAEIDPATYCDGIGCNASTKGVLKLSELGYKVKELIGGIDWWKRDGYPIEVGDKLESGSNETCGCA